MRNCTNDVFPNKLLSDCHRSRNSFDDFRISPKSIRRKLAVIIRHRIIDLFGCSELANVADDEASFRFTGFENLRAKVLVLLLYRS